MPSAGEKRRLLIAQGFCFQEREAEDFPTHPVCTSEDEIVQGNIAARGQSVKIQTIQTLVRKRASFPQGSLQDIPHTVHED
jgi:hypothetical protein